MPPTLHITTHHVHVPSNVKGLLVLYSLYLFKTHDRLSSAE